MFEDFRKQTDETLFVSQDDEEDQLGEELVMDEPEVHFLGMTSVQRLALVVLLFFMSVILGILFLLITDRVVPAFFG